MKDQALEEFERLTDVIEPPEWIDRVSIGDTFEDAKCTLEAIAQGGCASGAYMPAVTYYDARQTMAEHGDDVLDYIQDHYGELPSPRDDESWSGIACHYLSMAVEIWASAMLPELQEAMEESEAA